MQYNNLLDGFRRPEPPHRKSNPFQAAPLPIPLEGFGLRAPDVFRERPLAAHISKNAAWLQARPRTSDAIHTALFPDYSLNGMEPEEIRVLLNRALWDAGYKSDNQDSDNPTWRWRGAEYSADQRHAEPMEDDSCPW